MRTGREPPLTLLDSLREGIQMIAPDWRYRYVNPAAASHGNSTPEALVGRTMMECYPGIEHTPLFAELERCMQTGAAIVLENTFNYTDGTARFFELRVEPVPHGICVLSIDITDRKHAEARARESEERLRHGERLESIGRLSAGIAHDFNNLLGVMLGQGEVALRRPSGPTVDDVELMVDVARRSAALTRELLAFGRRQVMQSQVIDPREVVSGMATILRRTLGSGVELRCALGEAAGAIDIDPGKLEQVLMNLVINARDAMPEGGQITISVAAVEFAAAEAERHGGAQPGAYVMISVADNGVGMDADTRAHIFEPFFTTKERGSGTGLGLATVYGIVTQSRGTIWVYSEPGLGTIFKLYFPRAERVVAQREAPAEVAPAEVVRDDDAEDDAEGDESILVVEDHPALRALAEATLGSAGYHVYAVGSGPRALEQLAADPSIALLITDMILPGMHGPEIVARARALRPTLKVLCTSGYASDSLSGAQALPEGAPFLEKPYLPSVLLRVVRGLLDGA